MMAMLTDREYDMPATSSSEEVLPDPTTYLNANDNYLYVNRLQSGPASQVFQLLTRGDDRNPTGEWFVIKFFEKENEFLRERDMLILFLHNTHVITGYGTFRYGKWFGIAMENAEGGDCCDALIMNWNMLTVSLREHGVPFYFHQVMQAMYSIHKAGVASCDLKWENFVIQKDEYGTNILRLIDFAYSQQIYHHDGERIHYDFPQGTLLYLSPDTIKREDVTGTCTWEYYVDDCDRWSAGIMLFMLVFGMHPFVAFFMGVQSWEEDKPQQGKKVMDPCTLLALYEKDPCFAFVAGTMSSEQFWTNVDANVDANAMRVHTADVHPTLLRFLERCVGGRDRFPDTQTMSDEWMNVKYAIQDEHYTTVN